MFIKLKRKWYYPYFVKSFGNKQARDDFAQNLCGFSKIQDSLSTSLSLCCAVSVCEPPFSLSTALYCTLVVPFSLLNLVITSTVPGILPPIASRSRHLLLLLFLCLRVAAGRSLWPRPLRRDRFHPPLSPASAHCPRRSKIRPVPSALIPVRRAGACPLTSPGLKIPSFFLTVSGSGAAMRRGDGKDAVIPRPPSCRRT